MKRNVKTWVTHGETENLEDREEGAVRRGMPAAIAPCSLDDILLSLSCLSFILRGVKSSFFRCAVSFLSKFVLPQIICISHFRITEKIELIYLIENSDNSERSR